MQRALGVVLGVVAALTATQARTETIEWKQSINLPKGLNLPKDVKADILGIEIGDRYEELKPKLEALVKESIRALPRERTGMERLSAEATGADNSGPIVEKRTTIRVSTPGGFIEPASYIGQIEVTRELPGTGKRAILDYLAIQLSAPASGQQVLGLKRTLFYYTPEDQPRISELMARLQDKYKTAPQNVGRDRLLFYRFQFDNGRAIAPPNASMSSCPTAHTVEDSRSVPNINPEGNCDVVLEIRIKAGLTQDHAESIEFVLSDNERTKANKTADFGFIETAVREMQGKAKGVAPKL
jgi:hypothetical protein